jgi:trimethylamine--corrinoid protein Co-methyltransferase
MVDSSRRRAAGRGERAARVRASKPHPAFLTCSFPPLRVLAEEGLALIEENADTILQEIGMEFRGDPEVLDILRKAGVDVRGERARFEKGQCRRIIQASAPRSFTQHARNSARSVVIGDPHIVLGPAGGSPFVHDLDRGRRYATTEDFENLVKLCQGIPCLHHAGGLLLALMDKPIPERHLHYIDAQFRLSDKCVLGAADAAERAVDSVKMAEIVFGERFVAENCVLYAGINTNSPLVLDATMMDAMKVYARANQAVTISAYVLAGAMGPVGLAGALAQQLAESMAGLALYQLIRPGAPCTMGTYIGTVSMQTGAPAHGTPETMLGSAAAVELARRLGVPSNNAGGATTASRIPDAQAAYESALTLNNTFLSGANIIWHCAGWLEGGLTTGYEKLLLDADLCSALETYAAGIDLSTEGQSMDALREVQPGGHFLGAAHTQRNFETALWRPAIWDTTTYEQWTEEGSLDAAHRANKLWKRRLKDYEPPPLDPSVSEALFEYRARRLAQIRAAS